MTIELSDSIDQLAPALHAAQGAIRGYEKNARNPHFKNEYATLESVIAAAKPALQANGITFTQAPGTIVNGALQITTMLLHVSGQWMRSTLEVPLAKHDAQGVGSAVSYARRYALTAVCGLAEADDDGEAGSVEAMEEALNASIDSMKTAGGLTAFMRKSDTERSLKSLGAKGEEIKARARKLLVELPA